MSSLSKTLLATAALSMFLFIGFASAKNAYRFNGDIGSAWSNALSGDETAQ